MKQNKWTIADTIRTILVIVGTVGIIQVFITGLQLHDDMRRTVLCASFCALLDILCFYFARFHKRVCWIPIVCYMIWILRNLPILSVGIKCFYNQCVYIFSANSGWEFASSQPMTTEQNIDAFYLCLIAIFIITAYMLAFTIFYVNKFWPAVLVQLPIYLIFIIFNSIPGILAFACLIFVLFTMAALYRGREWSGVWIGIVTVMVLVGVAYIVPQTDYQKPMFFRKINAILAEQFQDVFHSDLRDEEDIDYAMGGMHRGKLGQFSGVSYQEQDLFRLTTADVGHGQYLAFFYGDIYQNNQWYSQTAAENRQISDVLSDTLDRSEKFQNMLADDSEQYYRDIFTYHQKITQIATLDLTLFSQMVKKSLKDKDKWEIQRTEITGIPYDRIAQFAYKSQNVMVDATGTECELRGDYATYEAACKERAEQLDLQVPDSVRKVIEGLVGQKQCNSIQDREDYAAFVRQYLSQHCVYSRNPGSVPDFEDFVSYFLTKKQQGYCTYFATSAVMMLRCAGIPARYVEGYYISKDEIHAGDKSLGMIARKDGKGNERVFYYDAYTVSVKDHAAHAWVEYYLPGYGWKQFEATPGSGELLDENEVERPVLATDEDTLIKIQPEEETKPSTQNNQMQPEMTTDFQEPTVTQESVQEESEQMEVEQEHSTIEVSDENVVKKDGGFTIQFIYMLIGVFVFGLVVGIIVLRYKIHEKKEKMQQKQLDVQYEYRRLEMVFAISGYSKAVTMDYREYAVYLESVSDICRKYHMQKLMDIVLAERFGQDMIAEEVRQQTTQRLHQIQQQLMQQLPWWKRVYYTYIRLL